VHKSHVSGEVGPSVDKSQEVLQAVAMRRQNSERSAQRRHYRTRQDHPRNSK